MQSDNIKDFIKGLKVVSFALIPFFALIYLIESLILNDFIGLNPAIYNTGAILFLIVIYGIFLLSTVYWFKQRNWWAMTGSIVGGGMLIMLLTLFGIYLSCAQGTCF